MMAGVLNLIVPFSEVRVGYRSNADVQVGTRLQRSDDPYVVHESSSCEVVGEHTSVILPVGVSPATLMGPPFRHEHGTTSSPFVPADRDVGGPARPCQPVGFWRVRRGSGSGDVDGVCGFCRLR